MISTQLDDGRWTHTVRQSDLKTATICGERARREFAGLMPRYETCAASVGTAVHAAIEMDLLAFRDQGEHYDQETLVEVFLREYEALEDLDNFKYVKYTPVSARSFGTKCVRWWYQEVRPEIRPRELELNFTVPLWQDEQRSIELSGTIDLIDWRLGLLDWKTAGSSGQRITSPQGETIGYKGPYAEWEYQRWSVQGSAYTYAANELGMSEYAHEFSYCVLHANGVQRFTIKRQPGHWRWLKQQAVALATLVEADLPTWHPVDSHALCSDKWCGAWSDCKGKFVTL